MDLVPQGPTLHLLPEACDKFLRADCEYSVAFMRLLRSNTIFETLIPPQCEQRSFWSQMWTTLVCSLLKAFGRSTIPNFDTDNPHLFGVSLTCTEINTLPQSPVISFPVAQDLGLQATLSRYRSRSEGVKKRRVQGVHQPG